MAVAAVPDVLLPPVRNAGAIPVNVRPLPIQSPQALFANIVNTALGTSGPLPAGLGRAQSSVNAASLLDRSYFRDLVAGFGNATAPASAITQTPSFIGDLGLEAMLGRTGLPESITRLSEKEAVALYSAALNLFSSIQAIGGEAEEAEASIGTLLDITV